MVSQFSTVFCFVLFLLQNSFFCDSAYQDSCISYIFIHSTGPSNYLVDIFKSFYDKVYSSIDPSFIVEYEKKIWDKELFCKNRLKWCVPQKECYDFFYPGLIKTDRYFHLIEQDAEAWNFNFPFTLNSYIRMLSGKKLYKEIKEKISKKKIYIVGHSHGSDVLMNAIDYAIKIGDDDFFIDTLVLWGSPINNFTEDIVQKKNSNNKYYIGKVCNVYSSDDIIQLIDFSHHFPVCKKTLFLRENLYNICYKQDETIFHVNIQHLFTPEFKKHLEIMSKSYTNGFFIYNKASNNFFECERYNFPIIDFAYFYGKKMFFCICSVLYLLNKFKLRK